MTAMDIKNWVLKEFGIKVRCRTTTQFLLIWIMPEPYKGKFLNSVHEQLIYKHTFPTELGNKCMRIVYKGHPNLESQDWGGNIGCASISMRKEQWAELLGQYGVQL